MTRIRRARRELNRPWSTLFLIALLASCLTLAVTAWEVAGQIAAGTVNARQAGTWTVQPGNTANTTAWLVTGTGGTFPVSGTLTAVTTVSTVTNLSQMGGAAISMNTGVRDGGTQRVTIATNDSVPTVPGALTAIATGQQAVTATAAVLPTSAGKQVCVKVLIAGTQVVYYGPTGVTTSTGMELSAGDATCLSLDNANRIFVIAAGTGSTVAWQVLN